MKLFTTAQLMRFIRQTFFIGLLISVAVYTWVRLLFFEAPLSFEEESVNLFKVIATGWLMIALLKGSFNAIVALFENVKSKMQSRERKSQS